jgi:hypothetical protein
MQTAVSLGGFLYFSLTFFKMCFFFFLKKCFDVTKNESNFEFSVNVLCMKSFVIAFAFSFKKHRSSP